MLDWWWWQADFSWWHHTYGLIIPSWGEIGNVPSNDALPNVNIPLSTTPIVCLLSLQAQLHQLSTSYCWLHDGTTLQTLTKVYTGCPIVVCRRLEIPLQSRLPCLWLARHWYCNKADYSEGVSTWSLHHILWRGCTAVGAAGLTCKYYMLCTLLLYFLQDHIHPHTQTCHGWSLKVYGACVHVDGFRDVHWGARFCIAITVDSVENGVWFRKASGIGKKRSIDYEDVTKWTLISLLLVVISIGCNFLLVQFPYSFVVLGWLFCVQWTIMLLLLYGPCATWVYIGTDDSCKRVDFGIIVLLVERSAMWHFGGSGGIVHSSLMKWCMYPRDQLMPQCWMNDYEVRY